MPEMDGFEFLVEMRSRIDRLLAVSDFTRKFVRDRWGREATTLYPPCPIDLYSNLTVQKRDLVVTVGRMAPEKRMELFLEIARRLPDIDFAIIGSIVTDKGSYYDMLRAAAPANVSFVVAPLRKVREILGSAKVYVHCAQNEHFGITIVEAMAAGCVPVVNDSGGPPEIVSDDVGYRWNSIGEKSKAAVLRADLFGPAPFELGIGGAIRQYE